MPTTLIAPMPARAPILLAAVGLALAPAGALAQSDPLSEPFPAVLELADLDGVIGFRIDGFARVLLRGEFTGRAVASAGDANGDGIADVLIGAPKADPDLRYDAGECYVVFGRGAGAAFPEALSLDSLDGANGFRLPGAAEDEYSGNTVAWAGDVNGDGVSDVLIGGLFRGSSSRGPGCYVVFGRGAGAPYPPDRAVGWFGWQQYFSGQRHRLHNQISCFGRRCQW